MFDNLLTRITSPSARRRHTYHCPEVHSDPEENEPRRPRVLERRKKGRRALENGLRQARSLGRLDGIKEAERLADYGRLLGGSQPILDGRVRDLDRIQDLFPNDFLGLHINEINTTNTKTKSLRKRSTADQTALEALNGRCNRKFLVEAPCAMSPPHLPLNAKARHLFLFNDLLLIAKPRSSGSFKLKESVRVSELWLSPNAQSETGFLFGYPSPARTFLVTFCTQAARNSWWNALQQTLSTQLRLEPATTNIKVVYRDPLSGVECSKLLGIGAEMSSGEIARLMLDERAARGDFGYTLYAKERDNAPCALLGCERPHSIQLARLRQSLCAEEGFDLQHCNARGAPSDIVFELRRNGEKSGRKIPLKLFRKQTSRLFGVPLSRLCVDNSLPPVLSACFKALYHRGPHTQGIFRRCASARALRELKERIDTQNVDNVCDEIQNTNALLLGALLKEFLRSLPEPVLVGSVQDWLQVAQCGRVENLRRMVMKLPKENRLVLAHVVCVLHSVAKQARYNLMSATNLGVCVGPSLLWESVQNAPLRTLPTLIEMLINNYHTLFGSQVGGLLGEAGNDSGAEESDSLHSLGLSLDSIDLHRDQKSLSRDSGLTLSSEDDRESPNNVNNHNSNQFPSATPLYSTMSTSSSSSSFHRSDWTRQAARMRSWCDEEEGDDEEDTFEGNGNERVCLPPLIPPRRPMMQVLRHLPPVHLPPVYRAPPPPPIQRTKLRREMIRTETATARMLLVTADAESESYV